MNRRVVIVSLLTLVILITSFVLFASCGGESDETEYAYSFKDDMGREVKLKTRPSRVISLSGSFAETYMLAGGKVIGTTFDAVEDLHLDLGDGVELIGTVKEPDVERITALNPDFVIMSTDIAGHRDIAGVFDTMKIPYAFFKVESFDDYLSMLKRLTDITGREDLYKINGLDVASKIEEVLKRTASDSNADINVLFVRARSQGVAAKASDHMVCTMLDEFGVTNIAAKVPSLLENISMEQIIKEDPDIILVTTMGDEDKAREYLEKEWVSNPAWKDLSAVKNGKYVFLPKDLYHYKPNARWGEAYEELEKILFQ